MPRYYICLMVEAEGNLIKAILERPNTVKRTWKGFDTLKEAKEFTKQNPKVIRTVSTNIKPEQL